MEDQYFAERGVSLTADAEERVRDNPRETLATARNQLFNNRVRKPNMRPTELSHAANQSRVRRRQESSGQRDKDRLDAQGYHPKPSTKHLSESAAQTVY